MPFKYNATGVEMGTKATPAPEGFYKLRIEDVSETKNGAPRVTSSGYPYVRVECEIASGDHEGKKVWHNVTFMPAGEKGAGMAVHFLKNIGQAWEGEFEVEPENWVGALFEVKLKVVHDAKYGDKNEIAFIVDPLPGVTTDEVPF